MLQRLPDRRKIDQLLRRHRFAVGPSQWVDLYFVNYDIVQLANRETYPDKVHFKRMAHLLHRKLCNALLFLHENSTGVDRDMLFESYMGESLKGWDAYEMLLQSEMFYPDRFAASVKKYPAVSNDEIPVIHACIVIHCCIAGMNALAEELLEPNNRSVEKVTQIAFCMTVAFASTLMFRTPLIREIAKRDARGQGRRKGANPESWLETMRGYDLIARRLLRKAVRHGHTDRYESHQAAKERRKLNKWALALDIGKHLVEAERNAKAKEEAARSAPQSKSLAERRAEEEAIEREAKTRRVSINKDLLELYGNDLSIADVLSHRFEWHLIRKKPVPAKRSSRREKNEKTEA